MKQETDYLLARYFGGNASSNDMQALEQWLSLSADNQKYFDELTRLYEKTGGSEFIPVKANTELAKKKFMAYIAMNDKTQKLVISRIPFYKSWMFRAASVVFILMLSVSGWLYFNAEHDVVLATQMTVKQDILPDQTHIKLDENSKIIYSSNFGKKSKNIKLEGKARFEVGHKGNGTLQINADETFIEDIGTTFTVAAYPDSDKVSVNVSEGKVHFYTKTNNGIILLANETGVYNKKTKEFAIIKISAKEEIKHIQFNAMDLQDALKIISEEYGVTINLEQKKLGNKKITVNFDGENIDMVLEVMAETLDLKVTKVGVGYLLSENKKPAEQ